MVPLTCPPIWYQPDLRRGQQCLPDVPGLAPRVRGLTPNIPNRSNWLCHPLREKNRYRARQPSLPARGLPPFTPNKPDVPDDLTEVSVIYRRVDGSVRFSGSFYPETGATLPVRFGTGSVFGLRFPFPFFDLVHGARYVAREEVRNSLGFGQSAVRRRRKALYLLRISRKVRQLSALLIIGRSQVRALLGPPSL